MKSEQNLQAQIEISRFSGRGNVTEYHVMFHTGLKNELFEKQLESILQSCSQLMNGRLSDAVPVFMRFFISDSGNQSGILHRYIKDIQRCAVSVIEQPPLDGSKVALWVYFQTHVTVSPLSGNLYQVKHNCYQHFWGDSLSCNEGDSESQTRYLLDRYVTQLQAQGCTLADNCIRTWFFVQNVDVNYAGMVKGRNEVFDKENLTSRTHFISSTGINGRTADYRTLVQMDSYAVKGLKKEQIHFLYGSSHLNSTSEYGVRFERGTYVDYGDRRQVFISGTASIDNKGEILYVGDIRKQTARMLENVSVLLDEAGCTFQDVRQMIVYLRDVSDYEAVKRIYDVKFASIPHVIVLAPVCRPGWLIEMECIAVRPLDNPGYNDF